MSNLEKPEKWKPKTETRTRKTLNQLEGYRTEKLPKQGNVTPNRNHQLERKQLELIRLERDQGRVFNTKGSPNRNHQPALVINFIRFIVWVNSTPTELL
jgi:hypothetical protein